MYTNNRFKEFLEYLDTNNEEKIKYYLEILRFDGLDHEESRICSAFRNKKEFTLFEIFYLACEKNKPNIVKLFLDSSWINIIISNMALCHELMKITIKSNSIESLKLLLSEYKRLHSFRFNNKLVYYMFKAYKYNVMETFEYLRSLNPVFKNEKIYYSHESSLMCNAIYKNDIDVVKYLIENEYPLNDADGCYDTPVLAAIKNDNITILKLLLDNGAFVNDTISQHIRYEPLYCACYEKKNNDIIKLLIEYGANPNFPGLYNYNDCPLFMIVKNNNLEIFKILYEKGYHLTYNKNMGSLLYNATFTNNIEIVKMIIDAGYDNINEKICYYKDYPKKELKFISTPLLSAVIHDNLDVAKLLIENGANLNDTLINGENSLYIACYNENYNIVELLLNNNADISKKANNNEDSLSLSLKIANPDILYLIFDKKKVKINNDFYKYIDNIMTSLNDIIYLELEHKDKVVNLTKMQRYDNIKKALDKYESNL